MSLETVAAVQEANARPSQFQSIVNTLEDQKRYLVAKIQEDRELIWALQKQICGAAFKKCFLKLRKLR